jgi:type I restriction enzyme S subunit
VISIDALLERPLPEGWEWRTMGDIADVVSGGTPKTSDASNFDNGNVPWLTPADLSGYTGKFVAHGARLLTEKGLQSCSAKLIPKGSVLFTSRAPIGYVAIASNPIATNQGFKNFVLRGDVLPEYVYWWLKGAKQLAESLASGTTFLEISGSNAKKLPIPIAPLSQQAEIVAEIEKQFSRLDEAVANLQRVKANLKRYKAAVLNDAVEGRLLASDSPAVLVKLGSVANLIDPQPSHRTPPTHPGGVPYIGIGDVLENGKLDFQNSRKVSPTVLEEHRARYTLRIGDFIFGKIGTLGRPTQLMPPFTYTLSANVVLVQADGVRLLPEYALIFMDSPKLLNMISRDAKATTQAAYGIKRMRDLEINLPPVEQQRKIVAEVDRHLSIIREIEVEIATNLKRAQALRQATLAKAFSS